MKKKLIELPKELYDKIESLSKENDRSVNKQKEKIFTLE